MCQNLSFLSLLKAAKIHISSLFMHNICFLLRLLLLSGATWPGLGGVSSPTSAGSAAAAPPSATSPGPDYTAYHQYYQQYAQ